MRLLAFLEVSGRFSNRFKVALTVGQFITKKLDESMLF